MSDTDECLQDMRLLVKMTSQSCPDLPVLLNHYDMLYDEKTDFSEPQRRHSITS